MISGDSTHADRPATGSRLRKPASPRVSLASDLAFSSSENTEPSSGNQSPSGLTRCGATSIPAAITCVGPVTGPQADPRAESPAKPRGSSAPRKGAEGIGTSPALRPISVVGVFTAPRLGRAFLVPISFGLGGFAIKPAGSQSGPRLGGQSA